MTLDELRLALSNADSLWLHYDGETKQIKMDPQELLLLLPLSPFSKPGKCGDPRCALCA